MKHKSILFEQLFMFILASILFLRIPTLHDNVTYLYTSSTLDIILGYTWYACTAFFLNMHLLKFFKHYPTKTIHKAILVLVNVVYFSAILIPYDQNPMHQKLHVDLSLFAVASYICFYIYLLSTQISIPFIRQKAVPYLLFGLSVTIAIAVAFQGINTIMEIFLYFTLTSHMYYVDQFIDKYS